MARNTPHTLQYVPKYARMLIKLAWTVEVIAVLIGFTISIVVAISAYYSFADETNRGLISGTSSILVAALPFLLIAVVELCKIPLTFTFMVVRHIGWRMLFMAFVLFLCLITFETMFNGFERNFSNLNRAIDVRRNEMQNADSQIALLEKRRDHIVKFTEDELVSEVDGNRSQIIDDYRRSTASIDRNTQQMLSEIDYAFKDELEDEIAELMTTRDQYYSDWAQETDDAENRYSVLLLGNISGSSDERERLLAELEALKAEFEDKMRAANFFTRATVENKYRRLISEKENQLGTITTGYLGADAIEKQSSMENQLRQQLEFINAKYTRRIDDINDRIENNKREIEERLAHNANLESSLISKASTEKARFARIRTEQSTELDSYYNTKLDELEVITDKSFGIDEQIFELNNQKRLLQTEINHLINQNQIYRLAMYAYNHEQGTDVSRGEIGIVAIIWFGSLSLISSVCGVMLAIAGFYLRRFEETELAEERQESLPPPETPI